MTIQETANMLEQDALATGHAFSDCADVFMRAKQECAKERDELKYKSETAEQALREACCLLRECLPLITGGPGYNYLNNRISLWLEAAGLPNRAIDIPPTEPVSAADTPNKEAAPCPTATPTSST